MSTDWSPTLWKDTFNELLEDELEYNDSWSFQFNHSLKEDASQEERRRGWKIYSRCIYGTFKCSNCSKTWPSAQIMVVFHYRLRSDRGTVLMRAFRQACRHCSGKYEKPGFTKQAVEELLLRLMGKIKKNCYGCADDGEYNPVCSETVRTKPHESSLCEACSQGICCKDE